MVPKKMIDAAKAADLGETVLFSGIAMDEFIIEEIAEQ